MDRSDDQTLTALPNDHYRVHITRGPLPSRDTLAKELGQDNVSNHFDQTEWTWQPWSDIPPEQYASDGECIFHIHSVLHTATNDELRTWGLKQRSSIAPEGYRRALVEELVQFNRAHPGIERDKRLYAFGSYATDEWGAFYSPYAFNTSDAPRRLRASCDVVLSDSVMGVSDYDPGVLILFVCI